MSNNIYQSVFTNICSQIVIFPQTSKCSTVEVIDSASFEEIPLDLHLYSSEFNPDIGGDDITITQVGIPNIELEFVLPLQVFATSTDINDAPIVENFQTPDLFFIEKENLNVSDLDEDQVIAIIENNILSEFVKPQEVKESEDNEGVEDVIPGSERGSVSKLEDNDDRANIEETQDLTSLSDAEMISIIEHSIPLKLTNLGENESNEETFSSAIVLLKVPDTVEELILSKRNAPNMMSATVAAPERNNEYITDRVTYTPQYSTYEPSWHFEPHEAYTEEPAKVFSYVEPTPEYYTGPLTVTVDQSKYESPYLNQLYKRNAPKLGNAHIHKRSDENFDMSNYVELLKIHDAYDIYSPFSMDNGFSSHQYYFYKRSPSNILSQGEYSDTSKNLHKRSATCGCSNCSQTTDSSCSPQIIEKPTFIIEEAPETVEKPAFKVTEKSETVTKPDFVIKEVTEIVPKPNFSVQEKVETVVKPNFIVEETSEKVKKPSFKVEEQPEIIVKPEFIIEETPEIIEKPEFTIEENLETVVKPKYKVETQTETIDKPNYVVKEHVLQVQKPEFVVTEKTEKVQKPEFKVEEKVEVVKKPKYQIQEQIVPVTKPNFIVEETEVVVEKPEFIVTEEIFPVQKPQYLIKESQEVVEKPEFYVTEIVETVNKPNYLVEETYQTVTKPSYNVEDDNQTVKKPQFVVEEQPQYVVKPEFVIEETTIPVVKPEYIIEEVVETVQKPSYLIKSTPCYVEKPEFVVHEVVEKVTKPSFNVVEKKETIKKPSFVVEEEVQTVYKPCFNVVTCSGPPRRVSPKFVKGSHSRHHYSRRPSYHRRKSHRSQQHHTKSHTSPSVHS